jgi:hypothetical protein
MMKRSMLAAAILLAILGHAQAETNMFEGKTTREFVAYCDLHRASLRSLDGPCAEWIGWSDLMLVTERPRTVCQPHDDHEGQAYEATLDWLKSRPDLAEERSDRAITAALRALYPC